MFKIGSNYDTKDYQYFNTDDYKSYSKLVMKSYELSEIFGLNEGIGHVAFGQALDRKNSCYFTYMNERDPKVLHDREKRFYDGYNRIENIIWEGEGVELNHKKGQSEEDWVKKSNIWYIKQMNRHNPVEEKDAFYFANFGDIDNDYVG